MKSSLLKLFLLVTASFVFGVGLVKPRLLEPEPRHLVFGTKDPSYNKLWKRVDSCTNKGLTQSALDVIQKIYEKAKKENNAGQFVKAVIHRMKFQQYKEENSIEKAIYGLQQELTEVKFPIKPVLHSLLATAYWSYYENNRWRFAERSTTINFKNDDISTWDIKKISQESINHYLLSVANRDSLKATKIDVYDDIISHGSEGTRRFRPTLFDFLAHRAISFFRNSEAEVSRPAVQFSMNDAAYLKPYSVFADFPIVDLQDSMSTRFYAAQLFQELTRFHMKDNDPSALIQLELDRLDFAFANSNNEEKDSLYLGTLRLLANQYKSIPDCGEILFKQASWYQQKGSTYRPFGDTIHKWSLKKALDICNIVAQKYKDSYGELQCRNLRANLLTKNMNVTLEHVTEPGKPSRLLVSYRNIDKMYFRVVSVSYEKYQELTRKHYSDALMNVLLTQPKINEFETKLEDDGDMQEHKAEVKMPAIQEGHYVLLSSLDKEFSQKSNIRSYVTFWSSNIAYMYQKENDGDYQFFMMHRQTGYPLPNVKAQAWVEYYDYKTREYKRSKGPEFISDADGRFDVPVGKISNDKNFAFEFHLDKDMLHSEASFYLYKPYTYMATNYRTFFFTDRSIYRPGQTIYFKLVAIETNGKENKIRMNTPVTVSFYDVNYQVVSTLELITNEFGTASGSFTAPTGVLNGQMYITDGHGSSYFSVEEYKRPKFETYFNPVKGTYQVNDEVEVTGKAIGYSGNNIDGARVSYRVTREARFPNWWYWYRWWWPRSTSQTEITNGVLTTNDTGGYSIKFKALPDLSHNKKDAPTYSYTIYADVTDANGETHSATTYVQVGYKLLTIGLDVDEKVNKTKKTTWNVNVSNLNGTPVDAIGSISVYKIKTPDKVFRERLWDRADRFTMTKEQYYKDFPNDLYADENNQYAWPRANKVQDINFNTAKDKEIKADFISSLSSGLYLAEAITKDRNGEEVKDIRYFEVYSNSDKTSPGVEINWFNADAKPKEPGEKSSYIQASSLSGVKYLFMLEHEGQTVKCEWRNADMSVNEIPVEEKHRGNFFFKTAFMRNNRFFSNNHTILVPFTNKELEISFETFRNKLLPGQKEEWKVVVKDKKGNAGAAEFLASMYDASLDAFRANYWSMGIYANNYSNAWLQTHGVGSTGNSYELSSINREYTHVPARYYDQLNLFGLYFYGGYRGRYYDYMDGDVPAAYDKSVAFETTKSAGGVITKDEAPPMPTKKKFRVAHGQMEREEADDFAGVPVEKKNAETTTAATGENSGGRDGKKTEEVQIRTNLNETAFFYPQLSTNEKGELLFSFTMPEALTKWKFMGMGHTKDLKYGFIEKEVITQKELMVIPNAPRFFRENDEMFFTTKISNVSKDDFTGVASIQFIDPLTNKDVSKQVVTGNNLEQTFYVNKGLSKVISWSLKIPEGYSALSYRIVAKAGQYSDGEEKPVPVLTNRMLVTESVPLPIRGKTTKNFEFAKLINQNNGSTTLRNHSLTLEFTANPAWYAVQALPYMIEYPYECAEQTFSRYYANALASHIVNSKPVIKKVFDAWKQSSPDAFLSNLQKNQELKMLMLEETPWVLDAKDESERKKRVALLFDLNRMADELGRALKRLEKMQVSNGGWPWFEGMPDDWYITQHIITGFGHLNKLGVIDLRKESKVWNMMQKAVYYCDARLDEYYNDIKRWDKDYKKNNHLGYMAIQYLYARSYYQDLKFGKHTQESVDYFKEQGKKFWLSQNRYMQAMLALGLHRYNDKLTAGDIMKSLKENALTNEEMGMYWKDNYEGYYWYEAPIEEHAMMVEAFDEVSNDQKAVDDLKVWLLKSKQTQNWKSTKATCEAVYAILLRGSNWLETEPNFEVQLGNIKIDPKNDPQYKTEPGTGYLKTSWRGSEIKPEMGKITVKKMSDGVSWGALHWQYFEQLDKITPHASPIKINKQLFREVNTPKGKVIEPVNEKITLYPGDKIKVRIEIRVDRALEYVHMKDMRASGFEPTNVFSRYKWQDGLGYYESTRDASTNFFFSYLNKGTYVFEYPLVVTHAGNFSNGITSIQCMYAPEFNSHSEGIRVKVAGR